MHDSLVQHVAPSNLCLWTGDSVGSGGISVWWPNFILIISFSYTTKKNKSKTNFWCDIGSVRRSALPTRAIPLRASRSPVRSLSASSITHGAPSFLRSFLPSALSSPRRQSRTRAPSTARPFLWVKDGRLPIPNLRCKSHRVLLSPSPTSHTLPHAWHTWPSSAIAIAPHPHPRPRPGADDAHAVGEARRGRQPLGAAPDAQGPSAWRSHQGLLWLHPRHGGCTASPSIFTLPWFLGSIGNNWSLLCVKNSVLPDSWLPCRWTNPTPLRQVRPRRGRRLKTTWLRAMAARACVCGRSAAPVVGSWLHGLKVGMDGTPYLRKVFIKMNSSTSTSP
jgi:hypothetical protein